MSETLKFLPCPFCGGPADWSYDLINGLYVLPGHIQCLNDECFGPRTTAIGDDAVFQWNTRASPSPGMGMTEEELARVLVFEDQKRRRHPPPFNIDEAWQRAGRGDRLIAESDARAILAAINHQTGGTGERDRALEELRQHVGWLKLTASTITNDNWRDARDAIERQLEVLSAAIRAMKRGGGGERWRGCSGSPLQSAPSPFFGWRSA